MTEENKPERQISDEEYAKMMANFPEVRRWLAMLPDEDDVNAVMVMGNLIARQSVSEESSIPESEMEAFLTWVHGSMVRIAIMHLVAMGIIEAHFPPGQPDGVFTLSQRGKESAEEILKRFPVLLPE